MPARDAEPRRRARAAGVGGEAGGHRRFHGRNCQPQRSASGAVRTHPRGLRATAIHVRHDRRSERSGYFAPGARVQRPRRQTRLHGSVGCAGLRPRAAVSHHGLRLAAGHRILFGGFSRALLSFRTTSGARCAAGNKACARGRRDHSLYRADEFAEGHAGAFRELRYVDLRRCSDSTVRGPAVCSETRKADS